MEHISRGIWKSHTIEQGELYVLKTTKKRIGEYLSYKIAIENRKQYDFEKDLWTNYSLDNDTVIPDDVEIKSKLKYDFYTGYCYVELDYKDDIIVSDLYRTKKQAQQIQQMLDRERWSVQALNLQKKTKTTANRKFAGIIPLKNGFLLKDVFDTEYGIYKDLTEAMVERNRLRALGVLI